MIARTMPSTVTYIVKEKSHKLILAVFIAVCNISCLVLDLDVLKL